ncbi:MAG: DUF6642 family protein [Sediminibacterium sp.]|jgi:hypothetical protein
MKKGIYCIEGLWDHGNIQDQSTVLPILDLLEKRGYCNYIYHDCATKSELEYFLEKWKNKKIQEKYPILYLAFHGDPGFIFLTHEDKYSLAELADYLNDKSIGKIIYFGSCSTLNIDKRKINSFLKKTGAIATIGYKIDIDWIQSAACDLFVFEALQSDKLDTTGIKKIHNKIISDYGNLHKILELRFVVNDKQHFSRQKK